MKRKRKWPYGLLVLVFLLACGLFFTQGKKEPCEPQVFVSESWDQFKEIKRLKMLLQGFAIQSIADVPCDAFEKVPLQSLNISRYLGVLKERDRALALQALYGSELCSFMSFDVTVDILPKVDLILCWDQLCALSAQESRAAILQFKKSGAKFLLMRHYPEIKENIDNQEGIFRPINWKLPPYNFPEPIIQIMEKGEHGMESLALWNLEKL